MADDKSQSKFVRWQGIAREHLGVTVNLILTLAAAAVGFGMDLLFKKDIVPLTKPVHVGVVFGLAILVLSIGLGICVNISRLSDFRWTTRRARLGDQKNNYKTKTSGSPPSSTREPKSVTVPRLSRWIETLGGGRRPETVASELVELVSRLQEIIGKPDDASDANLRKSYADKVRQMADADEVRRELLAKFDQLRAVCRERAEDRGELTWLLLIIQLVAFVFGILLLSIALFFQSYQPLGMSESGSAIDAVDRLRHGLPAQVHLLAIDAIELLRGASSTESDDQVWHIKASFHDDGRPRRHRDYKADVFLQVKNAGGHGGRRAIGP